MKSGSCPNSIPQVSHRMAKGLPKNDQYYLQGTPTGSARDHEVPSTVLANSMLHVLHSLAKCNFPFSWGAPPPDPQISRPGGLQTDYQSHLFPLKLFTFLDLRPQKQICVTTMSTISTHLSCSISFFQSVLVQGGMEKGGAKGRLYFACVYYYNQTSGPVSGIHSTVNP
jgi:hypothetical protein